VVLSRLDPETSGALLRRCRDEGTTLQGALIAALALAAAPALGGAPLRLSCASPVNLRPYLSPPIEAEAGLFMSAVILDLPVPVAEGPWALARHARAETSAALERGDHLSAVWLQGLLRATTTSPALFARAAEALFPAAIGVTNLGRVDVPVEYGPFRLVSIEGSVAVNVVTAAALSVCAASFEGRLSLAFLGAEPIHPRQRVAEIAARAVTLLRDLARAPGVP